LRPKCRYAGRIFRAQGWSWSKDGTTQGRISRSGGYEGTRVRSCSGDLALPIAPEETPSRPKAAQRPGRRPRRRAGGQLGQLGEPSGPRRCRLQRSWKKEEETINQGRRRASPQRLDATAPNQTSCALPNRELGSSGAVKPLVLPSASPSLAEGLMADDQWALGASTRLPPLRCRVQGPAVEPGHQLDQRERGGRAARQPAEASPPGCAQYGRDEEDWQGSRRALVSRLCHGASPERLEPTSSDPEGVRGTPSTAWPIVCGPKSPNSVQRVCS